MRGQSEITMTQPDQLEQQILGVKEGFDHLGPCGYSSTGTNVFKNHFMH